MNTVGHVNNDGVGATEQSVAALNATVNHIATNTPSAHQTIPRTTTVNSATAPPGGQQNAPVSQPDRLTNLAPELRTMIIDEVVEARVVKLVTLNHSIQLSRQTPGLPAILFASQLLLNENIRGYLMDTILSFDITTSNLPLLAVVKFICKLVRVAGGFCFRGIRLNIRTPLWHHLKDLTELLRLSTIHGAPFRYIGDFEHNGICTKEATGFCIVDSKFTLHFASHFRIFIGPFKHAFDIATHSFLFNTFPHPSHPYQWTVFNRKLKALITSASKTKKPGNFTPMLVSGPLTTPTISYGNQMSAWVGPNNLLFPRAGFAIAASLQVLLVQPIPSLHPVYFNWIESFVLQLYSTVAARKRELAALTSRVGAIRMAIFNSIEPVSLEWAMEVQDDRFGDEYFKAFKLQKSIRVAEAQLAAMRHMLSYMAGLPSLPRSHTATSVLAATAHNNAGG